MRTCWEAGRVVISGTLTAASKRGMVGCVSPLEKCYMRCPKTSHCIVLSLAEALAWLHSPTFAHFCISSRPTSLLPATSLTKSCSPLAEQEDPYQVRMTQGGADWACSELKHSFSKSGAEILSSQKERGKPVCVLVCHPKKAAPCPSTSPPLSRTGPTEHGAGCGFPAGSVSFGSNCLFGRQLWRSRKTSCPADRCRGLFYFQHLPCWFVFSVLRKCHILLAGLFSSSFRSHEDSTCASPLNSIALH